MNVLELIEKYCLTVRCLSKVERFKYSYKPGNPLLKGCTEVSREKIKPISREQFNKFYTSVRGFEYKDGFLYRYYQQGQRDLPGGFLVKIDTTTSATQRWSRKHDFYGKTIEEAVNKAVKHIESTVLSDEVTV